MIIFGDEAATAKELCLFPFRCPKTISLSLSIFNSLLHQSVRVSTVSISIRSSSRLCISFTCGHDKFAK